MSDHHRVGSARTQFAHRGETTMTCSSSRHALKLALAALGAAWWLGCAGEGEGGPPLFNAIDPSLQCPAGQVGWDFSTGGNDTDVIPIAVGSEIKIQEVRLHCYGHQNATTDRTKYADLTASFRADCDNAARCERELVKPSDNFNLSCADDDRWLIASYKCGNEPTVYDLTMRKIPGQSLPTLSVRNPVLPSSMKLLFACGDTITMRGEAKLLNPNPETYAAISDEQMTRCNGLRRCFSNQRTDLGKLRTNSGKAKTKFFYSCGKSRTVREMIAEEGVNPIDFSCVDDLVQTGVERAPVIFFKGAEYVPGSQEGALPAGFVASLNTRLKDACEGNRSCEIPVEGLNPVYHHGWVKAEYWCGTSQGIPETKYWHVHNIAGSTSFVGPKKIELRCGGRLRMASVGPNDWSAAACPDGVRVCSLPPGKPEILVNYFCEGSAANTPRSLPLSASERWDLQSRSRSLECPLEDEPRGIYLTGRRYRNGALDAPLLEQIAKCNNRNNCLVDEFPNYLVEYKCTGTEESKTAVKHTVNGREMQYLDCKPSPKVTEISGCITGPASSLSCTNRPESGCTVSLVAGNNTAAMVNACATDINVKYTCGSDTTVYTKAIGPGTLPKSPDGGAMTADGGSVYDVTVECPYDPTPRPSPSTKKCIPSTCPNTTKRNATMDCETDGTIQVFSQLALQPITRNLDGSLAFTLKEGYRYLHYLRVESNNAALVTKSQNGTVWAYDVFKRKDGTGGEIYGMRCIMSTPAHTTSVNNWAYLGPVSLDQASLLPYDCFKVPEYGDLNSSWYHGSRAAGINEQQFRNNYNHIRSFMVAAFDSRGRAVLATKNAPNPIGFFYTPATGYVDQFAYLAQQTDFSRRVPVTFQRSTQMDLGVLGGKLDQSLFEINADSMKAPPRLDFDFKWQLLGDSPYHPYSDQRKVQVQNLMPLKHRGLRATVEIAKEDSSLANKWTVANSAVLGAVGIGGGNAQEKVDRVSVTFSQDLVKRIMSVKGSGGVGQRPDGWMRNNIEVNSVFKARVCMDFDGLSRPVDQTGIDNKYVEATVGGVTYKLGVTTRCTPEFPFTVVRDLFVKPVLPHNLKEKVTDQGRSSGGGGDRVATNNDQGVQAGCTKTCTSSNECGTGGVCDKAGTDGGSSMVGVCNNPSIPCAQTYRTGQTASGKSGFGSSLFDVQSTSSSETVLRANMPQASSTNSAALMGFNILSNNKQAATGPNATEIKISLGRVWASVGTVADAFEKLKKATAAATPAAKPWWKPSWSYGTKGKNPLPGIAFGIGKEQFIPAGIASFMVEVNASVSLSFDVALKFISDAQTATEMNNPVYGCLGGTSRCVSKVNEAKTFDKANEDCVYRGGRLAEIRTSGEATSARSIAGTDDVWIGAQASYIFVDASCNDLSTVTAAGAQARVDQCKANSVTRYFWINGDVAFADAEASGALYNTSLYTGKHGFGSLSSIPGAAPFKAGVLWKANGTLESLRMTNELSKGGLTLGAAPVAKKYLCEFEPAAKYDYRQVSFGPSLEASAGVGAAICWPTTVVGACLSAEFKFITTGITIDIGNTQMGIYTNATDPRPAYTLGSRNLRGDWEVAALTGKMDVEIRFFFGSKSHNICKYDGVWNDDAVLFNEGDRFRR